MYLLDTDHLSILERGGILAQGFMRKLAVIPPENVAVTIITYEEQTRGWLGYIAKANSLEEQIFAYQKLEKHLAIFSQLQIIGFNTEAALIFKQLRSQHRRLGTMDLKIAAIALSRNAVLLTRNLQDFQMIENLQVEDWTSI